MRPVALILGCLLSLSTLLHGDARAQAAQAASEPQPASAALLWGEPTGRSAPRSEPEPQTGADDPESRSGAAPLALLTQAAAGIQWQHVRPQPVPLPAIPPIRAPPVSAAKA